METCGFIAILGAPNAGKSTLVNQLVGQKVSIVSPKVQTTRSRIMGIAIKENTQLILVDTPGIFTPKKMLDHAMVKEAFDASADSDANILVIDVTRPNLQLAQQLCEQHKKGLIICLNKIDLIDKDNLLKLAQSINSFENVKDIFMISALNRDGVDDLLAHLCSIMPKSPWLYPEDQITNIPVRSWAAEVTREQIFLTLHQELPYSIFVESESWEEFDNGSVKISQAIVVSRDNHKGIVLGKGGQTLKKIGQAARCELETQLERKVHLKLFVKVEEDWQERSWALRAFGIGV
ncbi:MAG: GTPase Era [Proteobacteria bacterium]|nr:GTPase Era [Pseudomonadota bacterium]